MGAADGDYPMKVCAQLRQLQSCDNMQNPYGVQAKTIRRVQKRATLRRTNAAPSPGSGSPATSSNRPGRPASQSNGYNARRSKIATIKVDRGASPAAFAPSAEDDSKRSSGSFFLEDDENDDDDDDNGRPGEADSIMGGGY